MLGKFGVGCCCDPFCLYQYTPWNYSKFIDWYEDRKGYKRWKRDEDNVYTIIDNRYLDESNTVEFHFDNWHDMLEFDASMQPSDIDYYFVTKEQILADLYAIREKFALRDYDDVPLHFIYVFTVHHDSTTRRPRHYLIPLHPDIWPEIEFSTLFLRARDNCGPSYWYDKGYWNETFSMIVTVTTKDEGKRLWLQWDDNCIVPMCSRTFALRTYNQYSRYIEPRHIATISYNLDIFIEQWWPPYLDLDSFEGECVDGFSCSLTYYLSYKNIYSGVGYTHDPEGYTVQTPTEELLPLFQNECTPDQDPYILKIYDYSATDLVRTGDYSSFPLPPFSPVKLELPPSGIWQGATITIYTRGYDSIIEARGAVQTIITPGEPNWCDRYHVHPTPEQCRAKAKEILDQMRKIIEQYIATIPPRPDHLIYVTHVSCKSETCNKANSLYDCYSDVYKDRDIECGALKIETSELIASAPACKYATTTNRIWLSCAACNVVECRSPKLPKSDDAVALHMRIPVDSNNKPLDDAGFYEVRSRFCNASSCSCYTAATEET